MDELTSIEFQDNVEATFTITISHATGHTTLMRDEALAIVHFMTRIGWPDLLKHSKNNDEAYVMMRAIDKAQIAFCNAQRRPI
ncbi:DUF7706 family protein [Collimonas fungivorans]|uniref:DUF7706 family protein n=1 Tax=Collimonas fungivorans TaxID=158899 RepID=UPI0007785F27|nr:hypothetical protein [Collimonas fungivorans]